MRAIYPPTSSASAFLPMQIENGLFQLLTNKSGSFHRSQRTKRTTAHSYFTIQSRKTPKHVLHPHQLPRHAKHCKRRSNSSLPSSTHKTPPQPTSLTKQCQQPTPALTPPLPLPSPAPSPRPDPYHLPCHTPAAPAWPIQPVTKNPPSAANTGPTLKARPEEWLNTRVTGVEKGGGGMSVRWRGGRS